MEEINQELKDDLLYGKPHRKPAREKIKKLEKELKKEKEKREIAEENYKVLSLDIAQACKDLGLYEDIIISDELVVEINKKFISKDKIKEIKQTLHRIANKEFEKHRSSTIFVNICGVEADIDELLEGNNGK